MAEGDARENGASFTFLVMCEVPQRRKRETAFPINIQNHRKIYKERQRLTLGLQIVLT